MAGGLAHFDRANWHPIAGAYSISDDGSDLRLLTPKDMDDYLKWHERIGGSGPKRIVTYAESDNANVGPELKGWILSTTPWDESDETVLVKIINNRLTSVNPNHQPDDLGAECDKAVPEGQRTRGLMEDCQTLLEMQYALADNVNAAAAFRWTGCLPISEWRGITVEDRRVRALEYVMGVSSGGTIPPQIAELTELRTLHISHNELEGEIPRELGGLSNLEILNLSGNKLEGEIPPELGGLSDLKELSLKHNELDGEIPPELANLANLNTLLLYDNRLDGLIPPELGDMPSLNYADLTENPLTGCVSTGRFGSDFRADIPPCE